MPTAPSRTRLLSAVFFLTLMLSAASAVFAAGPHHTPSAHKLISPAPTAEALFVKVLSSDDLFTYQGRLTTTYYRTGRFTEVLVSYSPPDDRRILYLNPESERGRLLVSNGKQQWEYDPRQKLLRLRFLSPGALDDDDLLSYTLLRANYLLSVNPSPQIVAGRKSYLVTVKRFQRHTLARRFWIDAGSGLILKREIYREDGHLAVTMAFSDIKYHLPLPPTLFKYEPPAKFVRVIQGPAAETVVPLKLVTRQLAGKASAPVSLAGYRLVGATATRIGGRPLLHLRYSDGLNLVSLFELRRTQSLRPTLVPAAMKALRLGPVVAHISHRSSLTTLNWDTRALNMTLMGEIGSSPLRALAAAAIQSAAK